MASRRLKTHSGYLVNAANGLYPVTHPRKGIVGGQIIVETNAGKSQFLTDATTISVQYRMGIVNGRMVLEEPDSGLGIVGGGLLETTTPETTYVERTLIINGQIYTVRIEDSVSRTITVSGALYEENATDVPPEESVSIEVGTGALTFTGQAPAITAPLSVTVGTGELTATGLTPTADATASISVTVDTGTLTATGLTPTADTTAAGWSITDVDTDEIIQDGQIGVICTVTNGAASGKRIFLAQGANWVEQEVTGETTTTVTINVDFGGVLSAGAARA